MRHRPFDGQGLLAAYQTLYLLESSAHKLSFAALTNLSQYATPDLLRLSMCRIAVHSARL